MGGKIFIKAIPIYFGVGWETALKGPASQMSHDLFRSCLANRTDHAGNSKGTAREAGLDVRAYPGSGQCLLSGGRGHGLGPGAVRLMSRHGQYLIYFIILFSYTLRSDWSSRSPRARCMRMAREAPSGSRLSRLSKMASCSSMFTWLLAAAPNRAFQPENR